jgi:hypothetical protein
MKSPLTGPVPQRAVYEPADSRGRRQERRREADEAGGHLKPGSMGARDLRFRRGARPGRRAGAGPGGRTPLCPCPRLFQRGGYPARAAVASAAPRRQVPAEPSITVPLSPD